jgi:hypothetical protein
MKHRISRFLRTYDNAFIIFFVSVFIISFAFIENGGNFTIGRLPPKVLLTLPGDFPSYAWRFLCSFFLLGVFPLTACLLIGKKPYELGLVGPKPLFYKKWIFIPLGAGIVIFSLINAYSPGLFAFYPYADSLVGAVGSRGALPFLLHAAGYTLFFYLPWEITFRGALILPFVYILTERRKTPERWETVPILLTVALLQTIPSSLLHFGHPYMETLGAVAFGALMAVVVLRTRSILWPVVIHAGAGVTMDLFIILRKLEVMP